MKQIDNLTELRKKNSQPRNRRLRLLWFVLIIGIYAGWDWHKSTSFNSEKGFLYQIFGDPLLFFSVCAIGWSLIHLRAMKYIYQCPVCYCTQGYVLKSTHAGSTEHYDEYMYRNNFYSYKTGTTDYYKKTVQCTCCGNVSIHNTRSFSKR